jgi:ATP-dependent DNA helicase RecG
MPLPINLQKVLAGETVEWEQLEFEAGWKPISVLHTLCALPEKPNRHLQKYRFTSKGGA